MSQNGVDFPGSDPSGTNLLDVLLDEFQEDVYTNHKGTERPTYVRSGMLWIDTTANPWILKLFQGTQDIIIGSANTSSFLFTQSGASELSSDITPQLGGRLDCNGHQVQWSKGADVASATVLPVLTDGNYFDITGTTAITSFDSTGNTGTLVKLHFDAILTLTHHATDLILPGNVNIITAAGDESEFMEYAPGKYRCTNYIRASGLPIVNPNVTTGVIGEIIDFAGISLQTNFLATDGAAVSRTTYANLFTAIGTTWGVGDGTTTFNVPNLARHTTVGSGGSGTGTLGNAVGNTGGAETHSLSSGENGSHTHFIANTDTNTAFPSNLSGSNRLSATGSVSDAAYSLNGTSTSCTVGLTSSSGSGTAHNNIQPSAVVYKQIRYQ